MADEKRDAPKPLPGEENFDPDDYIRTAVFYGRLDVVKDWLPHQRGDPGRVSELVLCPAAMYGQLEVLRCGLDYGEPASYIAYSSFGAALAHTRVLMITGCRVFIYLCM